MRYRSTLYLDDELNFKMERFLNKYHENTGIRLSKNKFIEALIVRTLNEATVDSLSEQINVTVQVSKDKVEYKS